MWLAETNGSERRTLMAGFVGFGLDGFDYLIYTFIIPSLIVEWGIPKAQAGYIATGTLLAASVGGWAAGILADRFGRVLLLQITVLWFAGFTFLSGFTHSFGELLATRSLQGLGFGGEWSVGSVLIAETIAARHRGKASGFIQSSWAVGWAAAALCFWGVSTLAPAPLAWRILFWIGVLPALSIVWIRRNVAESPVYVATRRTVRNGPGAGHFLDIFRGNLKFTTFWASVLCCGELGAYYAVSTWLPAYLKLERHLSVTGSSAYLLVLIAGSFTGYFVSAWTSDAIGRRRCFMVFAVSGILLILAYTWLAITDAQMLVLGFPLGFFTSGIFSGTGAYLTELYPNAVRGSGQGFCYNAGRAASAACPSLIGLWSAHAPLGLTMGGVTAACYLLVIVAAWVLPETQGRILTEQTLVGT